MKGLLRIIVVLIVLIAALVVGRNIIIKFAVEQGVKAKTGLPLKIQEVDAGLTTTHIGIKELNLFNPEGFSDEVMFHAPEIFVDYNLGAMMKGKIHLEDVRLNFDQFVIVKNKDGRMNLDALKPKAKEGATAQKPEEKAGTAEKKIPAIQIDHLMLKVGKVIYKDYSQGGEPVVQEYNVNISEEIDHVTDPNSLFALIAQKAMMQTALGSLGDLNVDVGNISSQAVEALQGEVGTLTDKIKLPFGQ